MLKKTLIVATIATLLSACGASATTPTAPVSTSVPAPASAASAAPASTASVPQATAGSAAPASTASVPQATAGSVPQATAGSAAQATAGSAAPASTASAAPASAASVPPRLEQVGGKFDRPLFVTHDGTGRTFVVEKGGTIRLLPGGELFLDISGRVRDEESERGLLGLAFHPRFSENGYLYVNYTDADGTTVVSRFTASGASADPNSEFVLLRQEQPAPNHNGGMLAFGPDGYLYIGLGDGGGANDAYQKGQNRETLLGKILRIDVNSGDPYAIPANNPFVNQQGTMPEIWALGLRNPWRFSFDRSNGDLYIGDVGQNRFEWIQYQPAGRGGQNYGWPITEGPECLRGSDCDRSGITAPAFSYSHDLGCSVTGGYVYRGAQFPAWQGRYFFGDYCSGRIWSMQRGADGAWQAEVVLDSDLNLSSFGEDGAGEIYVTDLSGAVYRLVV